MKCYLVSLSASLVLLLASTAVHALTPVHLWSMDIGGPGSDYGLSVTTDAAANVIATGFFIGTVDFGGGPLGTGGANLFVAKYSPAGAHLWSRGFAGSTEGHGVATDPFGNVCVTGFFTGTTDFGGGSLMSAGQRDIFVAKYSPAGAHLWSKRLGSTTEDFGHAIATDASGNVCVTGYFSGTVDFGGGPLIADGPDIFVTKYSPAGTHLWSKRFGGAGVDEGKGIATDPMDNVVVTGYFGAATDFGGGPLVSTGGTDIFVARYSPSGTHLWSRGSGGASNDQGLSVTANASGDVFLAGSFLGTADFGGGPLVSAGSSDVIIARYSSVGAHIWSKSHGGTSVDNGLSVATDVFGNVLVTGSFAETADFGGGPLVSAGGADIFMARYDADGAHLSSQRFGAFAGDIGFSIATDGYGNAILTGVFVGTANFGGSDLTSAGSSDIIIAKYQADPSSPLITTITDVGNDQGRLVKIRFDRSAYDQSGSSLPVLQYEAYRRDDSPPTSSGLWRNPEALSKRTLLDDGWTQVGTVAAHGKATYGIDVPTIGDSTIVLGQYHSAFFIRAGTAVPAIYFDSPIDSGYSVDNLAPGIPGSLLYSSGILAWNESPAEDFDYFTVYGASADDFGSATVVDYTVSPDMDVTAAGYVYYFVTATDFAGNEGAPISVNTLSGVGGSPRSYVLSVSSFPNPFNPRTTVSYTVPTRGAVSVTIYDARGARVATLVDNEVREAGAYRLEWDGRADSGRTVSSGVYFARVHHNDAVRSKKLVLLK